MSNIVVVDYGMGNIKSVQVIVGKPITIMGGNTVIWTLSNGL